MTGVEGRQPMMAKWRCVHNLGIPFNVLDSDFQHVMVIDLLVIMIASGA